jgi:isopentenyl-diphosphate delta-isomerase
MIAAHGVDERREEIAIEGPAFGTQRHARAGGHHFCELACMRIGLRNPSAKYFMLRHGARRLAKRAQEIEGQIEDDGERDDPLCRDEKRQETVAVRGTVRRGCPAPAPTSQQHQHTEDNEQRSGHGHRTRRENLSIEGKSDRVAVRDEAGEKCAQVWLTQQQPCNQSRHADPERGPSSTMLALADIPSRLRRRVNLSLAAGHLPAVSETDRQISSAGKSPAADYNDPDEPLAIVTEEDVECGKAPRALVHRLRLLHRAVHVLVFAPDGRLIIQKRSKLKDMHPLHWECVGGHLAPGENYRDAGVREVHEELGATPQRLEFLAKLPAGPETGYEFIEAYRAEVAPPVHPNPEEIAEVRALTVDELRAMIAAGGELFSPPFLQTLKAAGLLAP